jgi:translation initiation factor 2-alpha kinase 1
LRRLVIGKIGDFGLSTLLEHATETSQDSSGPDSEWISELTTGIGTKSYSSPEQLAGNCYTYKTDIYSCGLILFELFHPFNTMSEKAHVFRDLRNGHVPPKLLKMYPNEVSRKNDVF